MKKSHVLGVVTAFVVLPLCLGAMALANGDIKGIGLKATPSYSKVTLNSTVFGYSALTTSYQQSVTQNNLGQDMPVLNYFLAKKDSSNNLVLAPSGKLFNYSSTASYGGRITTVYSITAYYSGGALFVQEGIGGNAETYGEKNALANGTMFVCKTSPNYIMISNSQAETTITKIEVQYTCSEVGFDVNKLGEKYTGSDSSGSLYTLTRSGSTVDFSGFPGEIVVNNLGQFNIDFSGLATIEGTVSSDHNTLTIESISGPMADAVPAVQHLYRAYVVDDFESYADRGNGITNAESFFTASNLRAAYYVDVGNGSGSSTLISGSSFKTPDTGNYLNLSTNVKHSGNKAMAFQGRKAAWARLWTSDIFNTSRHYNLGRGSKLSFWAHSAYNNPDVTGVNSSNVTLRVQVYYENFTVTDSSRTTYQDERGSGTKDFTINSGDDWTQCIVDINPYKTVKAINIMINNANLKTDYVFVPIDDIEIYTTEINVAEPQFSETATRFTKSYHASVNTTLPGDYSSLIAKIGFGANGYIVGWAGANMEMTGYAINGDQIVFTTEGKLSSDKLTQDYYYGTWTGTLSENNTKITVQKSDIQGNISDIISSSEIVFTENTALAEDVETLNGMLQRQYKNNGTWTNDSQLRMTIDSDHYMQGGSCLAAAANSNRFEIRYFVKTAVINAYSLVFDTLAFWYYVPAYTKVSVAVYSYNNADLTAEGISFKNPYNKSLNGNNAADVGWHYVDVGLSKKDGYGKSFTIYIGGSTYATYLDYVTYF